DASTEAGEGEPLSRESGGQGRHDEQSGEQGHVPGVRERLSRSEEAEQRRGPETGAAARVRSAVQPDQGERGRREGEKDRNRQDGAWRSAKVRLQKGYSLIVSLTTRDVAQK